MRQRIEIPAGTRFGKLTVLGEGKPLIQGNQKPRRTLRCQCDCGSAPKDIVLSGLRNLGWTSCGCAKQEARTKHGMATRAARDPIYNCWQSIWARTNNPRATGYKYWGGRGIRMHEPWHDPAVFKADVEREIGARPSRDFTIERVDVEGHYEPGNIAWLPKAEQPLNRRPKYSAEEVRALVQRAVEESLARHHCAGCGCPDLS